MAFCLPKFAADALKVKLKSGEVTPKKLSSMSSKERRATFEFLGLENAKQVNALFESKLMFKNQQNAMIAWAKQILRMKPDILRDVLAKVGRMTELLSEKESQGFLHDLIEKKLGIDITTKEGGQLLDMAKEVEIYKTKLDKFDNGTGLKTSDYVKGELQARTEYGLSLAIFKDFVDSFKPETKDLTWKDIREHPIINISGISKSIVASIDNSLWGNQGMATLLNPKTSSIWVKNFIKSMGDIKSALKGNKPSLATKADIFSRPNAINGAYKKSKLSVGLHTEEAYPTSFPEKIPLLGRLFKASSETYNAGALRLRADIFDRELALLKKNKVDVTDPLVLEGIGKIVNSITGRGSLGPAEAISPQINVLLFSGKLLRGSFDTLTMHLFDPKMRQNPVALKRAFNNILGISATVVAVQTLANALNPGSAEMDPRGAHWGQIKTGKKTYINITGPYRSIVRLFARLLPTFHGDKEGLFGVDGLGFWNKDAKGKWRDLSDGAFGKTTALDMAEQFLEGKAAPVLGVLRDIWRGKDFTFKKPTLLSSGLNLISPITIKNFIEDKSNPETEFLLLQTFLNAIGINSTTYKK